MFIAYKYHTFYITTQIEWMIFLFKNIILRHSSQWIRPSYTFCVQTLTMDINEKHWTISVQKIRSEYLLYKKTMKLFMHNWAIMPTNKISVHNCQRSQCSICAFCFRCQFLFHRSGCSFCSLSLRCKFRLHGASAIGQNVASVHSVSDMCVISG